MSDTNRDDTPTPDMGTMRDSGATTGSTGSSTGGMGGVGTNSMSGGGQGTEGLEGGAGDPVLDTDVPGSTQGSSVRGDEGILGGSTPGTMSDDARFGGDNTSLAGTAGGSMGGTQAGSLSGTGMGAALNNIDQDMMTADTGSMGDSGSSAQDMTNSRGYVEGGQGAVGASNDAGSMTSSEGYMSGNQGAIGNADHGTSSGGASGSEVF